MTSRDDDAEEITTGWLASLGFSVSGHAAAIETDDLSARVSRYHGKNRKWLMSGHCREPYTNVSGADVTTRGDVRRVLAALCVDVG